MPDQVSAPTQGSPQAQEGSQGQPQPHSYQGPPVQARAPEPSSNEGGADAEGDLNATLEDTVNRLNAQKDAKGRFTPEKTESGDSSGTDKKVPTPKASVLASLHRREQAAAARAQELAKREAEIASREAVFAKGKHTPFEALKLLGYEDPKKFMESIMQTGGEWTPEQQKIYELEQWKESQLTQQQERERIAAEEAQTQQYHTLVDSWHKEIAHYTQQSPKWKESLVAVPGTEASVFEVIQEHYRETGEKMEFDDALEQVSQQMETQFNNALQQVASNPRGRAILEALAAKLAPNQAKRGKSSTAQSGLSSTARNQTRLTPHAEDVSLDDAVAANARWLSEVSRRG